MIPVSRPCIGEDELTEIARVFETGWLGLGSTVLEFENVLRDYLGAKHVVAVNTGTSALHLALDAFGVGENDEVIIPSLTFCAGVQAITALGATPVFCEVDPATLNIDVRDAANRMTPRTRAIMPVHYCGLACDLEGLWSLGADRGVRIIEDAAHAFGSSYRGTKIGGAGEMACFSFDPIKTITCGEGGALALPDDELAEEIRRKRLLGIDKDTWQRYKNTRSWFYEVTTQGYRYHMSNINAAIGLAQMKKLPSFIARRQDIVRQYNTSFCDMASVTVLNWDLDNTAPFTYIVRIRDGYRDDLMDHLRRKDIGTGIHYIPNHLHPFFGSGDKRLPTTEGLWKELLTLPLYSNMTDSDIGRVIDEVTRFFE